MDDSIEKMEYKGFTIRIVPDDCLDDPRDWDNLGTVVTWHRHYSIGDVQPKESPREWLLNQVGGDEYDSIEPLMAKFQKTNLVIPIMAYEHGGITIRAYDYGNFPDQQWDCGQLGFIYVSHDDIKKEWNVKRLTKSTLAKAERSLLSEIRVLDDWLTGNVVGYIVEDEDGETRDSCFGFYGDEGYKDAVAQAKEMVDFLAKEKQAEEDAMSQRLAIATAHS